MNGEAIGWGGDKKKMVKMVEGYLSKSRQYLCLSAFDKHHNFKTNQIRTQKRKKRKADPSEPRWEDMHQGRREGGGSEGGTYPPPHTKDKKKKKKNPQLSEFMLPFQLS